MNDEEKNSTNTTQMERLAMIKFVRYSAIEADRYTSCLMKMAERLEDEGILNPNRLSKAKRDRKIVRMFREVHESDDKVKKMLQLLPDHPDSENIIQKFYSDLELPSNYHPQNAPKKMNWRKKKRRNNSETSKQ